MCKYALFIFCLFFFFKWKFKAAPFSTNQGTNFKLSAVLLIWDDFLGIATFSEEKPALAALVAC